MATRVGGSGNYVVETTHTIGATASKVLDREKNRAGYRVLADDDNAQDIYHGHNSRVTNASLDVIQPGGRLTDEGAWDTIYRGEVWLISNAANQNVIVQEIIRG